MKSLRIIVSGRVQGVFFRRGVKKYCEENKIFGSVKNQHNGTVLIKAQGEEKVLEDFLEWLRGSPGFSKVEDVSSVVLRTSEKFKEFVVLKEENFLKDKVDAAGNLKKEVMNSGGC